MEVWESTFWEHFHFQGFEEAFSTGGKIERSLLCKHYRKRKRVLKHPIGAANSALFSQLCPLMTLTHFPFPEQFSRAKKIKREIFHSALVLRVVPDCLQQAAQRPVFHRVRAATHEGPEGARRALLLAGRLLRHHHVPADDLGDQLPAVPVLPLAAPLAAGTKR